MSEKSLEEILKETAQINRHSRRIEPQPEEAGSNAIYLGYDANSGLGRLQKRDGSIFLGQVITNGGMGKGEPVRVRGGANIPTYDGMPFHPLPAGKPKFPEIKKGNFKILFSVVEGDSRKFYVGGDRPTTELLFVLPEEAEFEAYITNRGKGKNDYVVSVKYRNIGDTENFYRYVVKNKKGLFFLDDDIYGNNNGYINGASGAYSGKNILDTNYRGNGAWTGSEILPMYSGGNIDNLNLTTIAFQAGFYAGTGIATNYDTTGGFGPGFKWNSNIKNIFINNETIGFNEGSISLINNEFVDSLANSYHSMLANKNYLPNNTTPDVNYEISRERTSEAGTRTRSISLNGEFLIFSGIDSFIKERIYQYQRTDIVDGISDIETAFTRDSKYFLSRTSGETEIDQSPGILLNGYFADIELDLDTESIELPIQLGSLGLEIFLGKEVYIAKLTGNENNTSYLATGEVTFLSSTSASIEVNSVESVPFVSFSTDKGKVIGKDSFFSYLLSGRASNSITIFPNRNESFYSAMWRLDYGDIASVGNFYAFTNIFSDLTSLVRERLKTDNIIKNNIFVSQVSEEIKTKTIQSYYAEKWVIAGDGTVNRRNKLIKAKAYSLGNSSAQIHGVSYWED